jgi:geranylgeranyl diphosphate synthase type I
MPSPDHLDRRLEELSAEVEAWTRAFFQRQRPASDRFAALLGYPLGWTDETLAPLDKPLSVGKKLRPALALLICETLAGDHRPALPPAAAVELVHNFSLVHDDIQDESPLRRGRPTVWALWQTAQAINVGDALFALAQLAVTDAASLSDSQRLACQRRLNTACLELVEGQFRDLDLQADGSATLEAYQCMVGGKTAALIACSCWLGAISAGASEAEADRFAGFGRQLGIAFQHQDDLLGVWGDPALTGKSAETDLRTRKQALPAVLGLQATGPLAGRFRELFLGPGELSPEQAAEAANLLVQLGVRVKAVEMVDAGYARAKAMLDESLGTRKAALLRALLERFRTRAA